MLLSGSGMSQGPVPPLLSLAPVQGLKTKAHLPHRSRRGTCARDHLSPTVADVGHLDFAAALGHLKKFLLSELQARKLSSIHQAGVDANLVRQVESHLTLWGVAIHHSVRERMRIVDELLANPE